MFFERYVRQPVLMRITVLILCGFCLSGCGNDEGATSSGASTIIENESQTDTGADIGLADNKADILPGEVTITDISGEDEYERYTNVTALYDPRMFWGQWVLKGRDKKEETPSAGTSQTMTLKRGKYVSEVECLPSVIQFGPLRIGFGAFDGFERSASIKDYAYAELLYSLPADVKSDTDPEDEAVVDILTTGGRWCRAAAEVQDGQLVFGLFGQDPDDDLEDGVSIPIAEMAYPFEWNGAELTLHKGTDTAVYVPMAYERDDNTIGFEKAYNLEGDETESFLYLSMTKGHAVTDKLNEPNEDVTVDYKEDGSGFIITNEDGGQSVFDRYYYSGLTLTLLSSDGITAFDCSNRDNASRDSKFRSWSPFEMNEALSDSEDEHNQLDENDYKYNTKSQTPSETNETLSDSDDKQNQTDENDYTYNAMLIEADEGGVVDYMLFFDTVGAVIESSRFLNQRKVSDIIDANLEAEIPAESRTDFFSLHLSDLTLYVRAVNIYNHTAALKDCFLCSAYIDQSSSERSISINSKLVIGTSNYESVKNAVALPVLQMDSDEIVYSGQLQETFEKKAEENGMLGKLDKDNQVLFPGDNCRYTFSFEDEVLMSWSIEIPGLLINETGDGNDNKEYEKVDPSEAAKEMDIRKGIAAKLAAAFEGAGIDAKIDRETGLITMDSEILFASASYELNDVGKDYIDRFSEALLPVLLEEDVKKNIEEIEVTGHTDTRNTYTYNLEISEKRASAVMDRILENAAVMLNEDETEVVKSLFKSSGKAFNDPIYNENGDIDMGASRRVEISFHISHPK